jgi:hypothetical protein
MCAVHFYFFFYKMLVFLNHLPLFLPSSLTDFRRLACILCITISLSNISQYFLWELHLLKSFFFETGSHYVAQAGLKLLGSSDISASASLEWGLQTHAMEPALST